MVQFAQKCINSFQIFNKSLLGYKEQGYKRKCWYRNFLLSSKAFPEPRGWFLTKNGKKWGKMTENAKKGGEPPKIDIFQKYFIFTLFIPKYIKKNWSKKIWEKMSV